MNPPHNPYLVLHAYSNHALVCFVSIPPAPPSLPITHLKKKQNLSLTRCIEPEWLAPHNDLCERMEQFLDICFDLPFWLPPTRTFLSPSLSLFLWAATVFPILYSSSRSLDILVLSYALSHPTPHLSLLKPPAPSFFFFPPPPKKKSEEHTS
jgi:hypothetical protein